MGTQVPSPKGHSPQFSAHICCGQMCRWIKMPLGSTVGLERATLCYMGIQLPPPKKGTEPFPILAHVYCTQTAGWIKVPLGTEVGLSADDIVTAGHPLPKRGQPPNFRPVYCGQTAGWIQMALGMEVGLGPCHIMLDGDPTPFLKKGQSFSNFWPTSIVAKRLHGSRCHLVWR